MKFIIINKDFQAIQSRPAWGAWIEIKAVCGIFSHTASRPAWGAWIEISVFLT